MDSLSDRSIHSAAAAAEPMAERGSRCSSFEPSVAVGSPDENDLLKAACSFGCDPRAACAPLLDSLENVTLIFVAFFAISENGGRGFTEPTLSLTAYENDGDSSLVT